MCSEIDLKSLKKFVKDKNVIMFLGNDESDQYSSSGEVKNIIKYLNKNIEKNAVLLHFGELHKEGQLDLGHIFNEVASKRSDIEVVSILQSELKDKITIPEYVSKILWHDNYYSKNKDKKRGFTVNNGSKKPIAGTKVWYDLHKVKDIMCIYLIGGSTDYYDEYKFGKDLDIEIEFYPIKRKFKGDGKTLVKKSGSREDKYGPSAEIDCDEEDVN
jgi:hypothetical protein